MAEAITIARPYAQAVFDLASAQHKLKDWSDMLLLLARIAGDPAVSELINNPRLTESRLAGLFTGIGAGHLDEQGENFVRLLAENRRLELLPAIATLYEIRRREAEGVIKAEMVTAFPASETQQARIVESLRKRLQRDIELTCTTDAALLGGAIIRAGDLVIDGSVRGKLERLGSALSH
ncbi:MAG: F0F1 ATP synthase subunit delta [Gammaproteobacteria bacterium]